ncbi:MAG: hypothetical protein ACR2NA_10655 [Solirubrobacterales bacterium]
MPDELIAVEVAQERGPVLHRTMRAFSDELLDALVVALRRHSDRLAPGRLEGRTGRCAVGALLTELDPETVGVAAPPRRRRRGPSIRHAWPAMARAYPRLWHLEMVFDKACAGLVRGGHQSCERTAASRVGLWFAAEARAELVVRGLERGPARPTDTAPRTLSVEPEVRRSFDEAVGSVRRLRPWLAVYEAERLVETWLGIRPRLAGAVQRATPSRHSEQRPSAGLRVPREWVEELEAQRRRLRDGVVAGEPVPVPG